MDLTRHFGSYKLGKLRGTWYKDRNSAVQSSQRRWAGQYKKYVQYDFKFASVYRADGKCKKYIKISKYIMHNYILYKYILQYPPTPP